MDSGDTVYQDYLMEWLKVQRYSISPQTLKATESYTRNQILPLLGHLTLTELNPTVLQNFVIALKDRGLANASVKRIFSTVHASLDTAAKMQLIPKNYASSISIPKVRRKHLQVWDTHQVQPFLKLASRDRHTYVAFHLALLTGMRQGEILGLRWADVDFVRQVLLVRQTLSHDGKEFLPGAKTSSGIRSIALDPETLSFLERHRQQAQDDKHECPEDYQDNDLVVCTKLGRRIMPRALMVVWYRLLAESGLPHITFHDLRHTHASLLLKSNVHPKIVSERLGHASVQITLDTYSHLLPNMQKEAAGKLGDDIFGSVIDE